MRVSRWEIANMSVMENFSLKGRVAVVTGGAGMYGRQIVSALAEAGATTFMASRNISALEAFAGECCEKGLSVDALRFDQGDEASILRLRDAVTERTGQIDVLVNNAVMRPMKDGYEDTAASFDESMHVNATGLFVVTRALGDAMVEGGQGGSIINIGSIQGMVGPDPTIYEGTDMHGWYPDYFFHKGGMLNFTRFAASYYGAHGIRCNCLAPGGFQTDKMPEAFVRQYSARTMLGRLANNTDLKGAIVFLASDASRYITATCLPVDGGYTSK
jgi:NAD(P)-dependent dehydrogenase (short-subunit alcohol dehydrogenase family)